MSVPFDEEIRRIYHSVQKYTENLRKEPKERRTQENLEKHKTNYEKYLKAYQFLFNTYHKAIQENSLAPVLIDICESWIPKVQVELNNLSDLLSKRQAEILSKSKIDEDQSSSTLPQDLLESPSKAMASQDDFLKLAGAVLTKEYDGTPEKLSQFLDCIQILQAKIANNEVLAATYIRTKLTGRARHLISEQDDVPTIINKLKAGIRKDRPEDLVSKIRDLRHDIRNTSKFTSDMEELSMKLKESYIQLGIPNETAENLSKETTLEALIKNTTCQTAKLILRGGNFIDTTDVLNKFVRACQDEEAEQPQSNNVFYTNRYPQSPRTNFNSTYRGNRNANYFSQNVQPNRQDNRPRGRSQDRRFQNRNTSFSPARNSNFHQNYNRNQGNGQSPQRGRWGSHNENRGNHTNRRGSFSRNSSRN